MDVLEHVYHLLSLFVHIFQPSELPAAHYLINLVRQTLTNERYSSCFLHAKSTEQVHTKITVSYISEIPHQFQFFKLHYL